MARAKRTDRAEARRRYRQTAAVEAAEAGEAAASNDATGRTPQPNILSSGSGAASGPSKSIAPPPAPRSGSVVDALRYSVQPADIRGDLALLPYLTVRTYAIWVPVAITAATAVAAFVLGAQANLVIILAFQAFLVPPPMAAAFLGGLLAPRGSWLVGLIVGLVSAVFFAVVIMTAPSETLAGLFRVTPEQAQDPAIRSTYAVQGFVLSPLMGLLVGAFAGFYRRFLRSMGAGQGRQPKGRRASSTRSSSSARR